MEAKTFDDLIAFAGDVLRGDREFEPVTIASDTLEFSTRIEGEGWGKRVDARLAKYILATQETLDDLLAEYPPAIYPEKVPRIRVEVKEGSSLPYTDIIDFAKATITHMTPQDTFIAIMTGLVGAAGLLYMSRWLSYKEKTKDSDNRVKELEIHERTKLEMLRPFQANADNFPEKFSQYERPARTLVSMLEPDDIVEFADGCAMDRDDARHASPRRAARSSEQTSYADGEYFLNEISYAMGELILVLEQDKSTIKAYTSQLSREDAIVLSQDIARRQIEEELPFTIKVQLNIHHTARKIKYASIIGTGDPRPDKTHKRLASVLS